MKSKRKKKEEAHICNLDYEFSKQKPDYFLLLLLCYFISLYFSSETLYIVYNN